jgi:capsule polysaccharide export protein KpsE/RkpR
MSNSTKFHIITTNQHGIILKSSIIHLNNKNANQIESSWQYIRRGQAINIAEGHARDDQYSFSHPGSYVQLNDKLMDKICALQEEIDTKSANEHQGSFQEEYSIMNNDFTEIEEQIKEYRTSLTAYQQQVQAEMRDKNTLIAQLNEDVAALKR